MPELKLNAAHWLALKWVEGQCGGAKVRPSAVQDLVRFKLVDRLRGAYVLTAEGQRWLKGADAH